MALAIVATVIIIGLAIVMYAAMRNGKMREYDKDTTEKGANVIGIEEKLLKIIAFIKV